jgi:hypothetical protein
LENLIRVTAFDKVFGGRRLNPTLFLNRTVALSSIVSDFPKTLNLKTSMSILKAILIVGVGLVVIFLLFLYYVLKDHKKDISKMEPYKSVVGKRLVLKQDVSIIKNLQAFSKLSDYLLTRKGEDLYEGTSVLYSIPKGTEMTMVEFKSVSTGPSKFWTGYGKGKIFVKELQSEIEFEYPWGGTTLTFLSEDRVKFSVATPVWEQCPFNDDIKGQSMEQVKDFENAKWDSVLQKAVVPLSTTETLMLSAGGCVRFDAYVSYKTTERVALNDHKYWNEKINWIFERVFKSESERFINAFKNKKLTYDSALDTQRRSYTFENGESYLSNQVVISSDGKSTLLEITWWKMEEERVINNQ